MISVFLNPKDEGEALQTEIRFFSNNPTLGKLIWWQLVGDSLSPTNISANQIGQYSRTLPFWQKDNLPIKMLHVREMFLTQGTKPIVFYFHCGQGQDRTGEFAGSYQMTFQSSSFEDAYNYNLKIGMDVPENINAFQWYCLYLKYSMNFAMNCTIP